MPTDGSKPSAMTCSLFPSSFDFRVQLVFAGLVHAGIGSQDLGSDRHWFRHGLIVIEIGEAQVGDAFHHLGPDAIFPGEEVGSAAPAVGSGVAGFPVDLAGFVPGFVGVGNIAGHEFDFDFELIQGSVLLVGRDVFL